MQTATDKPRKTYSQHHPYAHILPFPAGPLLVSQALATAEGRVYRSVLPIAFWYWISGCKPLPTDSSTLAAIARLPTGNLTPHREAIDAALSELLPMLKTEYDLAFKSRATRVAMATAASHVAHKSRKTGNLSGRTSAPPSRFQPQTAPPHRSDTADMPQRREAVQRARHAQGDGLLREGAPSVRK